MLLIQATYPAPVNDRPNQKDDMMIWPNGGSKSNDSPKKIWILSFERSIDATEISRAPVVNPKEVTLDAKKIRARSTHAAETHRKFHVQWVHSVVQRTCDMIRSYRCICVKVLLLECNLDPEGREALTISGESNGHLRTQDNKLLCAYYDELCRNYRSGPIPQCHEWDQLPKQVVVGTACMRIAIHTSQSLLRNC